MSQYVIFKIIMALNIAIYDIHDYGFIPTTDSVPGSNSDRMNYTPNCSVLPSLSLFLSLLPMTESLQLQRDMRREDEKENGET